MREDGTVHPAVEAFRKYKHTPGSYVLLANRIGGTLSTTISPVPVTLAIGDDSGTAQMRAKFD
jgi:hypothetical protein